MGFPLGEPVWWGGVLVPATPFVRHKGVVGPGGEGDWWSQIECGF